jgi:hypothetical protein
LEVYICIRCISWMATMVRFFPPLKKCYWVLGDQKHVTNWWNMLLIVSMMKMKRKCMLSCWSLVWADDIVTRAVLTSPSMETEGKCVFRVVDQFGTSQTPFLSQRLKCSCATPNHDWIDWSKFPDPWPAAFIRSARATPNQTMIDWLPLLPDLIQDPLSWKEILHLSEHRRISRNNPSKGTISSERTS